jgi:hypothetical protein
VARDAVRHTASTRVLVCLSSISLARCLTLFVVRRLSAMGVSNGDEAGAEARRSGGSRRTERRARKLTHQSAGDTVAHACLMRARAVVRGDAVRRFGLKGLWQDDFDRGETIGTDGPTEQERHRAGSLCSFSFSLTAGGNSMAFA